MISTVFLSLSTLLIQPVLAGPFPKDDLHDTLSYGFIQDRSCASYCGVENEHCCSDGEVCTTSDNVAGCTAAAPLLVRDGSSWAVYTTTWTETETFTSTISSAWAASTAAAGGTCTPPAGSGEIACGSICCANWQYCAYDGHTSTATALSASTTGSGNGTALATTGGSSLSGGAIAGIVIGVLAGVVILLGICACCIMRGLWHGLLALLGLGPRKDKRDRSRETVIVEEERYSRHGAAPVRTSSHVDRDRHSSWFANRPARSAAGESRRISEKKESNQTSWWTAGALGTLLVLLGLRRDKKRRQSTAKRSSRAARSEVSSSYFSDSYTASSPSEFSSDYTLRELWW
ncbi:hypothetical protein M406DRAFT_345000 [Cryphonectria parasitica EP155]|uniref:Uncharacterized protein n=1 Tax=Cryphonectria parasitica (strain ATCC 38755 / EP155) TaxID=660469 RepID=A0A9P5CT93_CRYP1|nr:uncharacterized protein M406DRAFT_345000 [Cryphonectria parasitica EP155]KAF3769176.1 hypothetical protein M406DRAFT_345000 [Cryphonectria parasitica EP155]